MRENGDQKSNKRTVVFRVTVRYDYILHLKASVPNGHHTYKKTCLSSTPSQNR